MTANGLSDYADTLYGCRFCPMCKPAGEVANLTLLESHATRARAIMLWRIANGMAEWEPRGVELLYQSTLDSISEAWCISHYPVSGYMLAARAQVYAAGLAPEPVRQALRVTVEPPAPVPAEGLLLAGEAAELADETPVQSALAALAEAGLRVKPALMLSGALAYSLGARDQARQQAEAVAAFLRASGARTVIADGPGTLWALKRIFPALGVSLPTGVTVTSVAEALAEAVDRGQLQPPPRPGVKVFVHDSRDAAFLADELAQAEVIQPGYRGEEVRLGAGAVYDAPRRVVEAMGMARCYSVWQRALSKSGGADDGLWRTYPTLAEGLARQRLAEARRVGAELVNTDSTLSDAHLARFAGEAGLAVRNLSQLIAEG